MTRDVAAETRRRLASVQRRIRLARALRGAVWGAVLGLLPALLLGALRLVGLVSLGFYVPLACPLLTAAAGALWLARRRPSETVAAAALDQGCETGALFRTLLEVEQGTSAWAEELRSEVARALDAREGLVALAAPLRVPQGVSGWLAFGLLITVLVALAPPLQLASQAEDQPQAAMAEDDLQEARRLGSKLRRAEKERGSKALGRASADLERFARKVSSRQLSRLEALAELGEVEEALQAERARITARGVVAEALRSDPALAEALAAETLSPEQAARARRSLERLARRTKEPSLRAGLEEAARGLGAQADAPREAGADSLRRLARELPPSSWDEQDQRVIDQALETLSGLRGQLSDSDEAPARPESSPAPSPSGESPADVEGEAEGPEAQDSPGAEHPDGEKSAGEQPAGEQPPGEQPAGEQPPGEQPAGEQPAGEQPAGEQPAGEQPAGEQPAGEQPAGEQPAGEQPAGEQPASEQPAGEQPAGEQPAGEQPAGEKPAGEQPAGEQPAGEKKPADERPAGEKPTGEQPAGEQPAGEKPTGDKPAGDKPTSEKPNGEQPAGEKPNGEQPNGEKPNGEQPAGEKPAGEQPPGEQPGLDADPEFDPMDVPSGGPDVPPAVMDMAAKMIKEFDAEDLRGLAERAKDLKDLLGDSEKGEGEREEPPPGNPIRDAGLKKLLEKLSDEDLEKLGKAFADLKDSMPPEDLEELGEKAKGADAPRNPALEKSLRDRLGTMDPKVLERLQQAMPKPQGAPEGTSPQPEDRPSKPGDRAAKPGAGKAKPGDRTAKSGTGTAKPGDRPAKAGAGSAKPGDRTARTGAGTSGAKTSAGKESSPAATKGKSGKSGKGPAGTKPTAGTKPAGPGSKTPPSKPGADGQQGDEAQVGRSQRKGGRVVEVQAAGGEAKLKQGKFTSADLERELKRLQDQRVPERYRRMVRDYFTPR